MPPTATCDGDAVRCGSGRPLRARVRPRAAGPTDHGVSRATLPASTARRDDAAGGHDADGAATGAKNDRPRGRRARRTTRSARGGASNDAAIGETYAAPCRAKRGAAQAAIPHLLALDEPRVGAVRLVRAARRKVFVPNRVRTRVRVGVRVVGVDDHAARHAVRVDDHDRVASSVFVPDVCGGLSEPPNDGVVVLEGEYIELDDEALLDLGVRRARGEWVTETPKQDVNALGARPFNDREDLLARQHGVLVATAAAGCASSIDLAYARGSTCTIVRSSKSIAQSAD